MSRPSFRYFRGALVTSAALLATILAFANASQGVPGGFYTGFLHPLTGPDHIVAMVAVGLWGFTLGAPAVWTLPLIFPVVMIIGGAWGLLNLPLPAVEIGIALSGVVLGLMVLFAQKPPLWLAAFLVAAFAVLHGYAHGIEVPHATDPIAYCMGFVLATSLLHLGGIGLGALGGWPAGKLAVRTGGGLIACTGFAYLTGLL